MGGMPLQNDAPEPVLDSSTYHNVVNAKIANSSTASEGAPPGRRSPDSSEYNPGTSSKAMTVLNQRTSCCFGFFE